MEQEGYLTSGIDVVELYRITGKIRRGVALTDTEAATLVAVLTWAGYTQRLVRQSIDDMLAPYRDILEEMSPFNTEE
jgi:hypothetical protein